MLAASLLLMVLTLTSAQEQDARAGKCPERQDDQEYATDCPDYTEFCDVDANCTSPAMKCCEDPCLDGSFICLEAVPV